MVFPCVEYKPHRFGEFMIIFRPNRLKLFWSLALVFASLSTARADSVDIFAGYDAGSHNSYFEIQDNTAYDLTNIEISATGVSDPTSVVYGWNNQWSVADVAAGQQAQDYFNGIQAFQVNFPATYAYSGLSPSDLTYQVSGVLNGQIIQLAFSGGDGFNSSAFLGLDQYGNATNASNFGQVVSYAVAAVPLPSALWLFLSALGGLTALRRKPKA